MLVKCKVDSSFSQISFGATNSKDYDNPWYMEGAHELGIGYNSDSIAILCKDWQPEPHVFVAVQDTVPSDEKYVYKGSYTISSPNKQFAIGDPDSLGEGITFLADKEKLEVLVYTDGQEQTEDIVLVIKNTELYLVIPYETEDLKSQL